MLLQRLLTVPNPGWPGDAAKGFVKDDADWASLMVLAVI